MVTECFAVHVHSYIVLLTSVVTWCPSTSVSSLLEIGYKIGKIGTNFGVFCEYCKLNGGETCIILIKTKLRLLCVTIIVRFVANLWAACYFI